MTKAYSRLLTAVFCLFLGGLLVDAERVRRGEMDAITELAREYRRAVK